jgi:hypothetical protein
MFTSYKYSILLLFIFVLLIAFIIRSLANKTVSLKKFLENLSNNFEMFNNAFSELNKCQLDTKAYQLGNNEIKKLLKSASYAGLSNPRITFITGKQCLHVDLKDNLVICNGPLEYDKNPSCHICKKIYAAVLSNEGFNLPNDVKRSYIGKHDIILYKKYICNKSPLYISLLFNL